jgi:hypothetical protein
VVPQEAEAVGEDLVLLGAIFQPLKGRFSWEISQATDVLPEISWEISQASWDIIEGFI